MTARASNDATETEAYASLRSMIGDAGVAPGSIAALLDGLPDEIRPAVVRRLGRSEQQALYRKVEGFRAGRVGRSGSLRSIGSRRGASSGKEFAARLHDLRETVLSTLGRAQRRAEGARRLQLPDARSDHGPGIFSRGRRSEHAGSPGRLQPASDRNAARLAARPIERARTLAIRLWLHDRSPAACLGTRDDRVGGAKRTRTG